jgi:hypothetical protein
MIFSHPLARSASVFTAKNNDGNEYRVLAIVTTLELDPKSQYYKKPFVEKLSRAASDYLADSDEAAAFILMNRLRDWGAHLRSTSIWADFLVELRGFEPLTSAV